MCLSLACTPVAEVFVGGEFRDLPDRLNPSPLLPEARAYIERRVSEGKTRREAHRCLRRYIVRAIWRLWRECSQAPATKEKEAA
jgi:hypothetical protein